MTIPAAEEPTRPQTTSLANKPPKAKPAPPSTRRIRVTRKAPPIARIKAKVRRVPMAVSPRPGSKTAKILALLKRPGGAGLKDLLKATGWQPHSIRGFLSGTVAKKMGLKVKSIKTELGERRYAVRP